jgi:hypothetical protein
MTELRAGKFNMHYMHRKLDRDRFASFPRPDGYRDQTIIRVCRHLLTQTNSNLEVTKWATISTDCWVYKSVSYLGA